MLCDVGHLLLLSQHLNLVLLLLRQLHKVVENIFLLALINARNIFNLIAIVFEFDPVVRAVSFVLRQTHVS